MHAISAYCSALALSIVESNLKDGKPITLYEEGTIADRKSHFLRHALGNTTLPQIPLRPRHYRARFCRDTVRIALICYADVAPEAQVISRYSGVHSVFNSLNLK